MQFHSKPTCATGNDADRCTVYALVALFALIASISTLVIDAISTDFGPPSPYISDSGADPNPSDRELGNSVRRSNAVRQVARRVYDPPRAPR